MGTEVMQEDDYQEHKHSKRPANDASESEEKNSNKKNNSDR